MSQLEEQLSKQFYHWERRGRGWELFPTHVFPEPPFVPFYGHYLPEKSTSDDGQKPTFLSSLVKGLSRKLSTETARPPVIGTTEEEPEPRLLVRGDLVEFQVSFHEKFNVSREAFAHFLETCSLCREPIAFELLSSRRKIKIQFAAAAEDAPLLKRQSEVHFPQAVLIPDAGGLPAAWENSSGDAALVVEFGLKREFMFPLGSSKLDPFIGIIGALAGLVEDEFALFQVLFQAVEEDWSESILRSVTHNDGKPFFVNRPELANAAEEKVSTPLFAAVVRILVRSQTFERVLVLGRDLAASLRVFARPGGNSLIPLANDGYPFPEHIEDVLCRQSRRSGMLLNASELVGFVHLPSSEVGSQLLDHQAKTKAAPTSVRRPDGLHLGTNEHAGQTSEVRLTSEQRVRHCHIIGASGTGKSTLLFNMIRQDIESGEGLAVLDPHGDLIDRILGIIPEARVKDVVLVNPADEASSIGFNILSAHSELEKNLLASDLVSVFERLSTTWGDQMNSVLQNAVLAFLESDRGGTIADLRRFLIEPAFQKEFLSSVRDPEVVYYWQKSFPMLVGNRSIGSVITRLDAFLSKKPIRYMVSQPENRLDFGHIMDTGKIFLAKLPEGLLGRENSHLLGTLLISKFQQITMSRQATAIHIRRDFWLYIDEFANFITPTMAEILSGARKYRIGLTLAHHELRQLDRDKEVASAVMSHPFTRIVFRVGDDDSKKLAEGFSYFEAKDLRNLETGHAVCRVERSDYDFNLRVPLSSEAPPDQAAKRRAEVIEASRQMYGTSREEVERVLRGRAGQMVVPAANPVEPPSPAKAPVSRVREFSPTTPTPGAAPAAAAAKIPPHPPTETVVSPGKTVAEESLHRRLKQEIGKAAESLGYNVADEERVPDGGRIDLVLRRGKRVIACEIHVKNATGYEVQNVEKCLKAGFSEVVVVAVKKSRLAHIENVVVEKLPSTESSRVTYRIPDDFIRDLTTWAKEDPEGGEAEKSKPHKQKISLNLGPMSEAERQAQEKLMLKELSDAIEETKRRQTGSREAGGPS